MKEKTVLLSLHQREAVENVISEHAVHRGWELHAVSARSNHVHVVVTAIPKTGKQDYRVADGVKRVRDQFKVNATRVLRQGENAIQKEKVWRKGGDIQFIDSDHDLEQVVIYVTESQDRMDRGK